uniref:Uncharacterized protein n=1 Tax=Amblyomma triste TaxID=251400 RepID=A0A023GB14_AMBTT
MDRLQPIKQQLRRLGVDMYQPCTSDGNTLCWMLQFQPVWNCILNPHGPELIQERPDELSFRTLHLQNRTEVDPAETLTSVCLALWVLSHHRCITSLHLNGVVISPCYIPVLYGLLRLHDDYVEVAVEGGNPVPHGLSRNCVLEAFRSMRKLRAIRLSGLHLTASAGYDLCTLVSNNVNLKVLDLRLVKTNIEVTSSLFQELAKLDFLKNFTLMFLRKNLSIRMKI